ncbi:MAG TPA: HPr(Ser) kinase/phosphatase [Nitrospirota bacterium]|nr:HPr(Ser) kinase/phosphatase [Nitrospirota bacterium]
MTTKVKDVIDIATVLSGHKGLEREITSPEVVSPDLSALTPWRGGESNVLHIRPSQLTYLHSRPPAERRTLVRSLMRLKPACIVVSGGPLCTELLDKAASSGITILKTGSISKLARMLLNSMVRKISLHGVLVEIFGLGTLIIGESAVGKSEAALDLVLRGHKLIADDLVILEHAKEGINGKSADLGTDLLQIRGLGIINVRALYGESATADASRVGLVVELEEWKEGHQYSLVGLRERRYRILGVNLPYLKLPVKPGRNMATLIEVAARNQMLKNRGIFTARDVSKRLQKRLSG